MADHSFVETLWYGTGAGARLARAALRPVESLYGGIVAARRALYDRGVFRSTASAVPALSIGNLTVGGTGKTPIAAWAAAELARAGARPAIVLRGYGDDEPLVHQQLNPSVAVVVTPDRISGASEAKARGADVVVLDDAFQHRRIRRTADWILVSADRWTGDQRLLPAGPWREPLRAAGRASVVLVTRKAASSERVAAARAAVRRIAPNVPTTVVRLDLDGLRRAGGDERRDLVSLRGASVRLIAAIGDPHALERQLQAYGAHVDSRFFQDHHAYTDDEIRALSAEVPNGATVVCTLKDAVKIAPRWPRAAPALWYVSQRVIIEDGLDHLSGSIRTVLDARLPDSDAAGLVRPSL